MLGNANTHTLTGARANTLTHTHTHVRAHARTHAHTHTRAPDNSRVFAGVNPESHRHHPCDAMILEPSQMLAFPTEIE